ncbi:hypothetical protein Tco_0409722 [Tanacetum coccineum]
MTKLTLRKISLEWAINKKQLFSWVKQKLCSAQFLAISEGSEISSHMRCCEDGSGRCVDAERKSALGTKLGYGTGSIPQTQLRGHSDEDNL